MGTAPDWPTAHRRGSGVARRGGHSVVSRSGGAGFRAGGSVSPELARALARPFYSDPDTRSFHSMLQREFRPRDSSRVPPPKFGSGREAMRAPRGSFGRASDAAVRAAARRAGLSPARALALAGRLGLRAMPVASLALALWDVYRLWGQLGPDAEAVPIAVTPSNDGWSQTASYPPAREVTVLAEGFRLSTADPYPTDTESRTFVGDLSEASEYEATPQAALEASADPSDVTGAWRAVYGHLPAELDELRGWYSTETWRYVEADIADGVAVPLPAPLPAPASSPSPGPSVSNETAPDVATLLGELPSWMLAEPFVQRGPEVQTKTFPRQVKFRPSRPAQGVRERKARSRILNPATTGLLMEAVGLAFEFDEVVEIFYDALPRYLQEQGLSPFEKAELVFENLDELSLNQLFEGFISNAAEDALYGFFGGLGARGANALGMSIGPSTGFADGQSFAVTYDENGIAMREGTEYRGRWKSEPARDGWFYEVGLFGDD